MPDGFQETALDVVETSVYGRPDGARAPHAAPSSTTMPSLITDDLWGIDDSGKPVRDDDYGAAAHRLVQRLLDSRFGLVSRPKLPRPAAEWGASGRAPGRATARSLAAGKRHGLLADGRV